jgi:hypothetical protein
MLKKIEREYKLDACRSYRIKDLKMHGILVKCVVFSINFFDLIYNQFEMSIFLKKIYLIIDNLKCLVIFHLGIHQGEESIHLHPTPST